MLLEGSSKEAVSSNIKTETKAGKPHKQAVAIAMAMSRRAKGLPVYHNASKEPTVESKED